MGATNKQRRAGGVVPSLGGEFRNRVKELRMVKASELRANPANWRRHPEAQRSALTAMLADVGYVNAVVARETPAGLELLDGHLRQDLAPNDDIPTLITDLNDEEAKRVLLTLDPLSGMATTDGPALEALLGTFQFDNAELRRMIADVAEDLVTEEAEHPERERSVPGMALDPHEHYDYLVVLCTTSQEWNVLCERLGLTPVKQRNGSLGTARGVRASALLAKMPVLEDKKPRGKRKGKGKGKEKVDAAAPAT